MADTVVFFEDDGENKVYFLVEGEAFTDDATQARRFGQSQAEQLAQVLREHYPQRVFELGVMV